MYECLAVVADQRPGFQDGLATGTLPDSKFRCHAADAVVPGLQPETAAALSRGPDISSGFAAVSCQAMRNPTSRIMSPMMPCIGLARSRNGEAKPNSASVPTTWGRLILGGGAGAADAAGVAAGSLACACC